MPASTLILPARPSYDRWCPAPRTDRATGYERTVAIPYPGGAPAARRIEHRVAGGDINPYLMLAAVLGAAMEGIEEGLTPPPPIDGNAYDQDVPQLAPSWGAAIDLFESDPFIARCLPRMLIRNLVMTKRQELRRLADVPRKERWKLYLERV